MMTEHHMVIEKTCGPDEGTYTAILDYGQHRQEINFNLQVSANSGFGAEVLLVFNLIDKPKACTA